jgi:hypothetical protein
MKFYKREDCRLCKSININCQLSLNPTPPADSYVEKKNIDQTQTLIPLDLYLCDDCGHTQLGHVIDAEEVYLNYIYETDSTLGLGEHFKLCADDIVNNFKPVPGGLVVDIGSNDGILLKYFKDLGMKTLGIDPMPGIAEKATKKGIETLPDFFNYDLAKKIVKNYETPAIISSNNLVADTDELDDFINGIKAMMDKNTLFFFETFYFYLQVNNNVWDFTYHEHYSYFTVKPLKAYFKKLGLEIIDIKPNNTKGGSMRVALQLIGGNREVSENVEQFIQKEEKEGFHTPEIFQSYFKKISYGKDQYRKFINKVKQDGKKIVGYGASATSTTLMYHYEMEDDLDYLVDDFEAKQDLYSPGMGLPVFPPSKLYEEKPDFIVILAWRYQEKIIAKHQEFIENGGKFILPLPSLKIIETVK